MLVITVMELHVHLILTVYQIHVLMENALVALQLHFVMVYNVILTLSVHLKLVLIIFVPHVTIS